MPNRTLNVLKVIEVLEVGPERILKDKSNPLEYYENHEFLWRYRFSKESVLTLFDIIKNHSTLALRGNDVPPIQQLISNTLILCNVIFK